jgi:hypothetical protein
MRPYSAYISRSLVCSVSHASDYYVEYFRTYRRCELASPIDEVDRLLTKKEKLRDQALEAEAKALRLRKQARILRKKARELSDRENRNILDLKMDKALAKALDPELPRFSPAPGVPPSPAGFSQVSFDSLGRISPVPTSNS